MTIPSYTGQPGKTAEEEEAYRGALEKRLADEMEQLAKATHPKDVERYKRQVAEVRGLIRRSGGKV